MTARIVIEYNGETGELRVNTPESVPLALGLLMLAVEWVKENKAPEPPASTIDETPAARQELTNHGAAIHEAATESG